jgi:outer membrane protein insertion porin family
VPTPLNLPSGDVDIEFQVEEKQTGQISAGAGYNSTDKLVGNLGLGIPNFRGNGQSLSFNVEFGSNRNSFSLSFTEPWMFGRPTSMGADLFTLNRHWFGDYVEGNQGASLRLGRRLSWPDNYFRLFGSYRLSRSRYYDFDEDFDAANRYKKVIKERVITVIDTTVVPILTETTHPVREIVLHDPYPGSILEYDEEWNSASRFSLSIIRDSRNLPEFATKGSKFSYTFENTGNVLGGFWEYQKHQISFSKFIPLFWKFALAAKVQYGVVTSPKGDNRILLSDRFTPGGTAYDGIVRGYDDGSLTPDSTVTESDTVWIYYDYNDSTNIETDPPDSTDFNPDYTTRVRGKYMLAYNFEIQFPIVEQQAYGLFFFDAGNSWLRKEEVRLFTDLYRGAGAGFRIVVPGIGTIGFDFAYSFDSIRGSKLGWKPHFQIGTTFR